MHLSFMRLALEEADKGKGWTLPNPCVGAVIVKEGRILSKGHHAFYGAPHAEQMAIDLAKESLFGATLYVTLEPCNHHGKTPPCTEAIIRAGISQVHIAMLDPNPQMRGESCDILRKHGILVSTGLCEEEALKQNEAYVLGTQSKRPFVRSKFAMTLDGKIATRTGDSKWISGEESLIYTHRLRQISDGVLVGGGTAAKDNPRLTVRHVPCIRQPKRVVLDPDARLPLEALNLLDCKAETLVLVSEKAENPKKEALIKAGAHVITVSPFEAHRCLESLYEVGIKSLLIEGGAKTHQIFFKAGLVDEINVFVAPKCLMGSGLSPLEGQGASWVSEASRWSFTEVLRLGEDVLIRGEKCLRD